MRKKILNVASTVILLLVIAVNSLFLREVMRYANIAKTISSIEREGNRIVYTKDGERTGWDLSDLESKYKNQLEKKSELIKSSDVASWIATSAETSTGRIIRLVVIQAALILLILAVYVLIRILLQDMGCLMELLRID